ncbi:hypothetical protein JHD50_02230 [Sulfurimonas sp. MAG313]|nr:hypothetical protein [Sulfurimonas sp. MAG313]
MPRNYLVNDNCSERIKPNLLRDVKTEALLVLVRTALERYFGELDKVNAQTTIEQDENAAYVYEVLQKLLENLQKHVVNVDYLINLVNQSNTRPEIRSLRKMEEPLMNYYDIMAQQVKNHYKGQFVYLPVFLVICILAEWILGEEKSTHMYPFLDEIDFLELMGKFEENRESFFQDDTCRISEIHELSFKMIQKLKSYKYEVNKRRVSKTRKKK